MGERLASDLLTVAEVAALLRVSRSTVYRERQRGRLRFAKVGGSAFVRRTEVDRYLRASERYTAA